MERRKKKHPLALMLFSFIFKLFPDQALTGDYREKGTRIGEELCGNVYPSNMCELESHPHTGGRVTVLLAFKCSLELVSGEPRRVQP